MVKIACQSCGKVLRFQEKYLGRKIHCPQCGHPQVLGQPGETAEAPPEADLDATSQASQGSSPPQGVEPRHESFATKAPTLQTIDVHGNGRRMLPSSMGSPFLGPPEQPDEIGRLGGYRILKQLGSGGMGVVFLAEDAKLNRQIALKVLPPGSVDDSSARDRFYREAQAAARLEHENIITIHQVSEDRGVMFLAMPLLKGRPLDQYFRENGHHPLPADEVISIGREISSGLAAAHDQGIIHRDIKPANIWLEDVAERRPSGASFRVKILDFGLARSARDSASLTQTGIIVGTPSYMSPEQARSPRVDARSDLFSLGCVLYEAATGRRPFAGTDAMAVLSSLAADIPLPPVELNAEIPFGLSDLIMELLEKNPDNRPSSARDVEERLRTLVPESVDRTSKLTTRLSATRTIKKPDVAPRWWLWVAGSAAILVLVVLAGVATVSLATKDIKLPKEVKNAIDKALKDAKEKKDRDDELFDRFKKGPNGEPLPPRHPEFDGPPDDFRFPPPKKKKDDKGGKEFGPKKGPLGEF